MDAAPGDKSKKSVTPQEVLQYMNRFPQEVEGLVSRINSLDPESVDIDFGDADPEIIPEDAFRGNNGETLGIDLSDSLFNRKFGYAEVGWDFRDGKGKMVRGNEWWHVCVKNATISIKLPDGEKVAVCRVSYDGFATKDGIMFLNGEVGPQCFYYSVSNTKGIGVSRNYNVYPESGGTSSAREYQANTPGQGLKEGEKPASMVKVAFNPPAASIAAQLGSILGKQITLFKASKEH